MFMIEFILSDRNRKMKEMGRESRVWERNTEGEKQS